MQNMINIREACLSRQSFAKLRANQENQNSTKDQTNTKLMHAYHTDLSNNVKPLLASGEVMQQRLSRRLF